MNPYDANGKFDANASAYRDAAWDYYVERQGLLTFLQTGSSTPKMVRTATGEYIPMSAAESERRYEELAEMRAENKAAENKATDQDAENPKPKMVLSELAARLAAATKDLVTEAGLSGQEELEIINGVPKDTTVKKLVSYAHTVMQTSEQSGSAWRLLSAALDFLHKNEWFESDENKIVEWARESKETNEEIEKLMAECEAFFA